MADRKFSTALLLDGKGGARQLEDDEIDRWRPDDGLLWVDLNLSNTAAVIVYEAWRQLGFDGGA